MLTAVAQVVLAVKLVEVVEWPVVVSGDGSFKRSASESTALSVLLVEGSARVASNGSSKQ